MPKRRVVVTGIGVISALGRNASEFWQALLEGRSGIGPLEAVDASALRFRNAAEVRGYNSEEHFPGKEADMLDRFAQFAVIAAREAVRDAALEWTPGLRSRSAILTGSCVGGQNAQDEGFQALYLHQRPRISPMTVPRTMSNAGASHISMEYGITGPTYTISTACSSSTHAIGQAFWMVQHGLAETALTGGSEAPFSMGHLKAWEAMRVVSPDTCRPFSKDRRGMILGEGGAMLVLEPLQTALARGARIHAEVIGFGMSSDAHHLTQPSVDGPATAMSRCLENAGIGPAQVGYINAHGTGTVTNDPTEAHAIRCIFGPDAARPAVSSTKSMHGHALGAAGAIEAIATVLALENCILPPTANFTVPDPECDLYVVPNQARHAEVEYALSNSFAFGGLNAVVGFKKWVGK